MCPQKAKAIYTWTMENPELLRAYGGLQGKYFKLRGRYYYAQSFQILQGSPNADVGAVIFDVTGLPDTSTVKEVRRVKVPDNLGGFHNLYTYKHSDGRVLLFSTSTGPFTTVWDMDKFVSGAADQGLIGIIARRRVEPGGQRAPAALLERGQAGVGGDPVEPASE